MKSLVYFLALFIMKLFQVFITGILIIAFKASLLPINDYNFRLLFYTLMSILSVYIVLICPIWVLLFGVIQFFRRGKFSRTELILICILMIVLESLFLGQYTLSKYSFYMNADLYRFNNYIVIAISVILDILTGILYGIEAYNIKIWISKKVSV